MPQSIQEAIYDYWDCSRTRVSVPGIAMMPLAGIPPQKSIPIVLDGGIDYEVIEFVAGRWGKPPEVPAPTSGSSNRIFIGGRQDAGFPIVAAGGLQFYRVSGTYIWGILDPEGLLGDFYLGSAPMPYQNLNAPEYIPAANFKSGLVNETLDPPLTKITARGDELRRAINAEY